MSSDSTGLSSKRGRRRPNAPTTNFLLMKPLKKENGTTARLSGVVISLSVLVPLLPWLLEIKNPIDAVCLGILAIVCTVGTVRSYGGGARLVGLVFYPFMFAWLTIGPIYQLSQNRFAWGDTPLLSEGAVISKAVIYTLAAVVSFSIGYELWRKRLIPAGAKREIRVRPTVVWALIFAGLLLAPLAVSASGGLSGMFASRVERIGALAQSGMSLSEVGGLRFALVKQLPIAVSIAAACLSVVRVRHRVQLAGLGGLRANDIAALVLSLGLIILYCNPLANSRYIAVIAFGSMLLYIFQPRSRNGGFIVALASVFGTLIIYPLLDIFRRGFEGTTTLKSGVEAFASIDFDGFQQVANAQIFVDETGHTFGHYTMSALLFFLPRSLWEGKATPASIDVASNRGYVFTDLSLPFHAEMFIEFGVVGMVVAMVVFGVFASHTDASWLAMGSTRFGLAAPLIAVALLGFLRGPLGSLAPIYMTAIGLFMLGLRSSKEKLEPRSAASDRSMQRAALARKTMDN